MNVTNKIKNQLLNESNWECQHCHTKVNIKTAIIYHKIPLIKGGSSDIENLAVSCPTCHLTNIDRMVENISNPLIESAAKLWIHSYFKSPIVTVSISVIITLTTTISIYYTEKHREEKIKTELSKNLNFKIQIDNLSETEKSLQTLLKFVSSQKNKMTEYEKSIIKLESEKEKLEPLVNADKKTVEALFQAQEERAKENATKERWIGFGLGILASIIASFAMVIGRYFLKINTKNS